MEWWSGGVVEWWSIGVLEYWSIGVLEYWSIGVLECWSVGVLECWGGGGSLFGTWTVGIFARIDGVRFVDDQRLYPGTGIPLAF
jgi:hypothetical protein